MKTSAQLKALFRNLSKKSNVEAEILLRNFMLERFLERIAVSEYKRNFILKGGMLIAAMVGIDTQTTMDMDAAIKGQTLAAPEITAIIERILSAPVDDGVEFSSRGIEEIREEAGYRVSIGAVLDKTRQTLKVDITTGDFVTPREIEYSFKLMFEDRTISIMAYNLETVLAEKFETVVTRGVANTRMRDFYDIYILTTTQQYDADTFKAALGKTIEKRGTSEQMADTDDAIAMAAESPVMIDLWQKYAKKYSYAADVTWEMAIGSVKALAALSGMGDKPEAVQK
ncbi:MAG: nucleotidyl transferase AbiEii/AbiGii toxin family protein [Clostridiales bacterium]|jgi:predicted nucleotidyltransferase component of viral defense system|nr:nucleotidyl transferase AbiEii/AbiGii toxin family protein [Clostridiales bacterium]